MMSMFSTEKPGFVAIDKNSVHARESAIGTQRRHRNKVIQPPKIMALSVES